MKKKLIIVTGNSLKFRELSDELDKFFVCEQGTLDGYNEIQGKPEEIILHKLQSAYSYFQSPVLVDDTSLHFDELGGFPGPYIKDFINHMPSHKMGVKFAGSRVQVGCRLGLYDGQGEPIISVGEVHGTVVVPKEIDDGQREFDQFVQLDGMDRPMLEYNAHEKNKFSHRGKALEDLISKLGK